MIVSIEQHVDWIADCVAYMRDRGFEAMEANKDAEDRWVAHVNEVAHTTLYPQANSWYTSRASHRSSCPISAASAPIAGSATTSRQRGMRVYDDCGGAAAKDGRVIPRCVRRRRPP
jgi:hypothetical protein